MKGLYTPWDLIFCPDSDTIGACSPVAQLVEQVAVNHRVAGSSPARGALIYPAKNLDISADALNLGALVLFEPLRVGVVMPARLALKKKTPLGKEVWGKARETIPFYWVRL